MTIVEDLGLDAKKYAAVPTTWGAQESAAKEGAAEEGTAEESAA